MFSMNPSQTLVIKTAHEFRLCSDAARAATALNGFNGTLRDGGRICVKVSSETQLVPAPLESRVQGEHSATLQIQNWPDGFSAMDVVHLLQLANQVRQSSV